MTKQEILEACIDKELEPYQVNYQFIKENPKIQGDDWTLQEEQDWFSYYTFDSKEEFESWKSFCIALFKKELKQNKKQAEREFDWLNLMYGLKQEYVEKD